VIIMTIVFQILAVAAVAVIAFFILRGGGARHQAIRRILLVLFVVAAAASVFFPQVLTWLANLVGIGRGTDLLLYVMVIAFLGFAATTYRRFRLLEQDITQLARKLALLEARRGDAPDDDA
jgi:small membrane protein